MSVTQIRGSTQILDGTVTDAKIATGIDAAKLADGSVSNTEFQYLDGVTSAIQTQLGGKASLALDNLSATAVNVSLLPGADNTIDLGDSTHRYGTLFIGTHILNADGSAGAPAFSFVGATDMGIYRVSSNLFFSSGGVTQLGIVNAGQLQGRDGSAAAPTHSFFNDTGMGVYRIGSNNLGFATGGVLRYNIDGSGNSVLTGNATVNGNVISNELKGRTGSSITFSPNTDNATASFSFVNAANTGTPVLRMGAPGTTNQIAILTANDNDIEVGGSSGGRILIQSGINNGPIGATTFSMDTLGNSGARIVVASVGGTFEIDNVDNHNILFLRNAQEAGGIYIQTPSISDVRTYTMPDAGGSDTFAMIGISQTFSGNNIFSANTTFQAVIYASDGSPSAPSYSFANQPLVGFFYDNGASGNIGVIGDLNMAEGNPLSFGAINESNFSAVYDTGSFRIRNNSIDVLTIDGTTNEASFTSHKIHDVADPTLAQDAATKSYVDSVAAGLDVKTAVRLATTANLTATAAGSGVGKTLTNSGTQVALSVDGVAVAVNDRILVKNQTTTSDNGIYTVTNIGSGSTNWVLTRATDFDGSPSNEVHGGDFTFVTSGTQTATGWVVIANGNIVVDTNPIVFTQFNAAVSYVADETTLHLSGNTFSVKTGGITDTQVNAAAAIAFSKLAPLTSAHILVGNVSNVATDTAVTGDVTISSTGVTTIGAAKVTFSKTEQVIREVPTGAIDSSNVTFTLAHTPTAATECVFLNGMLQNPGSGNDYTISGGTITFLSAPLTGSVLLVNYWY